MRTLHRYLTGQVIASLVMTVAVFTLVLLLGNALKEILPLLISGQVSIQIVGKAIALLIPFILVFALPMGMLTATLLVFGRFSADQELTAVRASGISLLSLSGPILLLSLLLCGVAAYINMDLGPRCRTGYKTLQFQLRAEFSGAQLPEGRFIREFSGFVFFVGKNRNGDLRDVIVFVLRDETNVTETVWAPRGLFTVDPATRDVTVSLFDGRLLTLGGDRPAGIVSFEETQIDLDPTSKDKKQKVKLSEMSWLSLRGELARVERELTTQPPASSDKGSRAQAALREFRHIKEDLKSRIRFQLHRQIAFAFASFGFTLVGIPLGIRMHRRETNVGIAIALVLVAIYYGLVLVASALDDKPQYMPHLLVWLPNLLFQLGGVIMLLKANKGA